MTATKAPKAVVYTPRAICLFPFLDKVDSGRAYSDNKYKVTLLFDKDTWKTDSLEMRATVLKVGQEYFQKPSMKLSDFKNPFNNGDDKDMTNEYNHIYKNKYYINPKSGIKYKPAVVGPDKTVWDDSKIAKIKSGDILIAKLSVYAYSQSGGGVTFGLQKLQFVKEGDALSQGGSSTDMFEKIIEEIDGISDTTDDLDDI